MLDKVGGERGKNRGVVIIGCELDFGPIDGLGPGMRGILAPAGNGMLETVQGSRDVARHGYVDGTGLVIPGKGKAAEQGSGPVGGDCVELAEGRNEVVGGCILDILDTEVIHDEGENNAIGGMMPESRGEADGPVAEVEEVPLETVIRKAASLFEAGHALANLHVDIAVGDFGGKVVGFDDFRWNLRIQEFHVFEALKWGAVVEILDVGAGKAGVGGGNGAVDKALGGGEAGALGRGVAKVIEAVTVDGEADTVGLSFERADGGHLFSIAYLAA